MRISLKLLIGFESVSTILSPLKLQFWINVLSLCCLYIIIYSFMISSYVMHYIFNLFLPCSLFFALWVNHFWTVLPCFEYLRKMEYMIDIFLINTVILKLFWICLSVLVLSADHESERGKYKTGANVSLFIINTAILCIGMFIKLYILLYFKDSWAYNFM